MPAIDITRSLGNDGNHIVGTGSQYATNYGRSKAGQDAPYRTILGPIIDPPTIFGCVRP